MPDRVRPAGMRLAPRALAGIWRVAAVLACGIALSTVARSFRMEVGVAERLGATLALASVPAVHLLVRDLHRRALPAGPVDLVAAELALRARSARALLAGGTAVALWTASSGGLPDFPYLLRDSASLVCDVLLPLLALIHAIRPWQVTPERAAERPRGPLKRLVGAALAVATTIGLLAGWTVWGTAPESRYGPYDESGQHAWLTGRTVTSWDYVTGADGWGVRRAAAATAPRPPLSPVGEPLRYARLDRERQRWELSVTPSVPRVLGPAVARLTSGGPRGRPAPLALSRDGHHVVYLDGASRRLVLLDLTTMRLIHLTGPLDDESVPEPALSADGGLVALTSAAGVELVEARTGARSRLPGVSRVLGLGPDGVVATAGRRALPGAPDTELVTLDRRGAALTRVPFDPTLDALATPDGSALAVIAGDDLVTMDPRTGQVLRLVPMRLPAHYGAPETAGWSAGGRLLVSVETRDPGQARHHLADPATGRSGPADGLPGDLDDAVFGRLR
ncbi:hypothetical protein ACIBG4_34650 [Nonomuraea sp. NPDC050383]|uniref:hypothetical protein n=1 Tax=Nonomuraea sp. NPDC050383 TaxID=3364362 RepID=UPI0037A2C3AE